MFPPPDPSDRQVYFDRISPMWPPEWCVQYGPNDVDRYADGLGEAGALMQWYRIHALGEDW